MYNTEVIKIISSPPILEIHLSDEIIAKGFLMSEKQYFDIISIRNIILQERTNVIKQI